ncbi:hypothetical protein N7513_003216 [Penicillium frequentans]|nr:hypothetical protein N7513_003216 [Penicillium glabrum]
MAPRTRHGQRGEGQEQREQALPKQSQEAQTTTAPPEPRLSPPPAPPPPEPHLSPALSPPPKPSEDPEVESLIRDQIERFKKEPNYEHHVNHYVPKIRTSLKCHIIEEAGRRAAMNLNETPEVIAKSIDPIMLDVTQLQGYYCDELLNWTDFESAGPRTF